MILNAIDMMSVFLLEWFFQQLPMFQVNDTCLIGNLMEEDFLADKSL